MTTLLHYWGVGVGGVGGVGVGGVGGGGGWGGGGGGGVVPLVTHGFLPTRTTDLGVVIIVSLIKPLYKQLLVIWDTPTIMWRHSNAREHFTAL